MAAEIRHQKLKVLLQGIAHALVHAPVNRPAMEQKELRAPGVPRSTHEDPTARNVELDARPRRWHRGETGLRGRRHGGRVRLERLTVKPGVPHGVFTRAYKACRSLSRAWSVAAPVCGYEPVLEDPTCADPPYFASRLSFSRGAPWTRLASGEIPSAYGATPTAALWDSDMTVSVSGHVLTLSDDGVPDHLVLEACALADGTTMPVTDSAYSVEIPTNPVLAATPADTNMGSMGVAIRGGATFIRTRVMARPSQWTTTLMSTVSRSSTAATATRSRRAATSATTGSRTASPTRWTLWGPTL